MQVNRELNTNIWDHISATKDAYNIYSSKEDESKDIQITYSKKRRKRYGLFVKVPLLLWQ